MKDRNQRSPRSSIESSPLTSKTSDQLIIKATCIQRTMSFDSIIRISQISSITSRLTAAALYHQGNEDIIHRTPTRSCFSMQIMPKLECECDRRNIKKGIWFSTSNLRLIKHRPITLDGEGSHTVETLKSANSWRRLQRERERKELYHGVAVVGWQSGAVSLGPILKGHCFFLSFLFFVEKVL